MAVALRNAAVEMDRVTVAVEIDRRVVMAVVVVADDHRFAVRSILNVLL